MKKEQIKTTISWVILIVATALLVFGIVLIVQRKEMPENTSTLQQDNPNIVLWNNELEK